MVNVIISQPEWETNTIVHKDYGTDNHTFFEIVAMKDEKKDVFERIPDDKDIAVGDVLQQKGGSTLWRIIDLHEHVYPMGTRYFRAEVSKIN